MVGGVVMWLVEWWCGGVVGGVMMWLVVWCGVVMWFLVVR